MNRLVFIRRIRFLFNGNVRMGRHKSFVIKSDMSDNSKTIGDDAKFEDITEMTVDV